MSGTGQSASTSESTPGRISVLARLPWLVTMQALVLTALVYPLRLKDRWLNDYVPLWRETAEVSTFSRFCFEQLSAFISFFYSPLVLKGTVASICLLSVLLLAGAARAVRPLVLPGGRKGRDARLQPVGVVVALVGFLGWTALSAFWSPTPRVSLDGLSFVLVFGLFFLWLLRRGVAADEVRQLACLFAGLGGVIAVISLLQASEAFDGVIFQFMFKFDDAERRNLYGSLLGHNTAVAHFMLVSALPALALALDPRGGLGRLAALAYVALAAVTALVTQSRSIWAVGLLLGAGFLYFISRVSGRRWPWRPTLVVGGALLLALVLQLIPSKSNPFYIESNPILRRFKDLAPARLKQEARLRLLVCSLPLIAEKPLMGHGLYAFQYVYPKAQADYFSRHPDSELGRTAYRSNMAHNEYLQVLVESGIVGLTLFLALLGMVAWRGIRVNLRLDAPDRLLHGAFGFAVLGACLDAFVNFPFHVPQLALPWILNMAVFASWRPDAPPPQYRLPGIAPEAGAGGSERFRPEYVARLVVGWAALFAIPLLVVFPARIYQADINYMNGNSYVNTWRMDGPRLSPAAREEFFTRGSGHLRDAIAMQPSHDLARYALGELYYLSGFYTAREEAAAAAGMPPLYAPAIAQINAAIEYLTRSTDSLRYHNTYFTLALCYDVLRSTTSDPEARARYDRAYKENLDTSLYFAPTLFEALHLLDRWHAAQPKPDRVMLLEIRRRIRRYNPHLFREYYQKPVERMMEAGDWETAASAVDALIEVQPDNPEYLTMAVDAHMYAGNHKRLFEVVDMIRALKVDPDLYEREYGLYRLSPSHPIFWSFADLWVALVNKDWGTAITELDRRGALTAHGVARLWAIQKNLREKLGIEIATSRFGKVEGMTDEAWNLYREEVNAEVQIFLFQEYDAARRTCDARLAMPGPPPQVEFWVNRAWLARRTSDALLLRECVDKIRAINPNHPTLPKLDTPIPVPGLASR